MRICLQTGSQADVPSAVAVHVDTWWIPASPTPGRAATYRTSRTPSAAASWQAEERWTRPNGPPWMAATWTKMTSWRLFVRLLEIVLCLRRWLLETDLLIISTTATFLLRRQGFINRFIISTVT